MNKVYLYTASENISNVNFLFFDTITSELKSVLIGVKNINGVWESIINILDIGRYTVVTYSGDEVLGKEEIFWDGGNVLINEDIIAKSIRLELNNELIHLISLQNGLTHDQSIMLLELYRLMGLDPSRPLYVDKNNRNILPEIKQTINDNSQRTIIQRIN